ncbi:DUF6220 domain-containing protein [Cytobacillus dafuensis]|uniref:Uncharacterized protein n=1 Tax=Cytobacillus dafuensis TaxID=1742359 RepID=A0A5B8YZM3_CYTDA|nr:DUF6220 domain-containing protein [Cytobacillus dafuensis]QED45981.1 hypothetical protein FSZ17_00885 [Cytobacillus dafuensis]
MMIEDANTEKAKEKLSVRVKYSQIGFFLLALILLICIVAQVYLAGMAIFEDPVNWGRHRIFVHMFEYISILMFFLGFIGRLPWKMIWGSFGMFALCNIQYYTAHGIAGALHPVLALVLFWVSFTLAWSSYRYYLGVLAASTDTTLLTTQK